MWNDENQRKNVWESYEEFDSCHQLVSLRKPYSVTCFSNVTNFKCYRDGLFAQERHANCYIERLAQLLWIKTYKQMNRQAKFVYRNSDLARYFKFTYYLCKDTIIHWYWWKWTCRYCSWYRKPKASYWTRIARSLLTSR